MQKTHNLKKHLSIVTFLLHTIVKTSILWQNDVIYKIIKYRNYYTNVLKLILEYSRVNGDLFIAPMTFTSPYFLWVLDILYFSINKPLPRVDSWVDSNNCLPPKYHNICDRSVYLRKLAFYRCYHLYKISSYS